MRAIVTTIVFFKQRTVCIINVWGCVNLATAVTKRKRSDEHISKKKVTLILGCTRPQGFVVRKGKGNF